MAGQKKAGAANHKKPVEQYEHKGKKRMNNPPVGLVTPETDQDKPAKKYAYDPHLDPQLVWAGKAERMSFEVPTVSLHVHERIDPRTIIEAVRKKNGNGQPSQASFLFERKDENPPLREAIDFYKHRHNWSNRLIAGDSLLVMNSLLEKEGMAGQVQMVYMDPPYGVRYKSNFQPFVNRRDVSDSDRDEDLSQEPEMVRAFRDTWELEIHSYLSYLRDRLWLAKELLGTSGSCFVQISDENVHLVRCLMGEVFREDNFCGFVTYKTTGGQSASLLSASADYLIWFAKDKAEAKKTFHQPTSTKRVGRGGSGQYTLVEPRDGSTPPRPMTETELEDPGTVSKDLRVLAHDTLYSQGAASDPDERFFRWNNRVFECPPNTHWKPGVKSGGMQRLADANRLMLVGNTLRYKRYFEDFPVVEIDAVWNDTAISGFGRKKQYVVETNPKVIERCVLMTTAPGDIVLDPTCGSGTTAYVAESWGRRWITCDSSRVSITLAKQRLMSALYDYYQLAHPDEGVGSGFKYTVPHVTLKSIANNEPAGTETLYDQPEPDKSKARVSGPFTVEAVPAPTVRSISEVGAGLVPAQEGRPQGAPLRDIARSGETLRQSEWRDVILRGGVRGKGGPTIDFSRVEPMAGTRWLHADAETKGVKPERVAISFGPEYAPLESRQVELAWDEARQLSPRPSILLFVYSDIDPEAGKDIAELTPEKTGMTFLGAKIDADVWTKDLKKKARTSPSVWLVGQPDVELRRVAASEGWGRPSSESQDSASGSRQGLHQPSPVGTPAPQRVGTPALQYQVEVHGFDYYNTKTGAIESGDTSKIALWLLDTDYDGRSLYPRQVFFPWRMRTKPGRGWPRT